MARIKFGAIVNSGSGSLGGHTFQNSKGGPQWRTKPRQRKQPTIKQSKIRIMNKILQDGWRALADVDQTAWNIFAYPDLSGHSLWMKLQFVFIRAGRPFELDPYIASQGWPYTELITNGSFNGELPWGAGDAWSFPGGKASYNALKDSSNVYMGRLPVGAYGILSFDILDATIPGQFRIYGSGFAQMFEGLPPTVESYSNGHYSWNSKILLDVDRFVIRGHKSGGPFSITNFSFLGLV